MLVIGLSNNFRLIYLFVFHIDLLVFYSVLLTFHSDGFYIDLLVFHIDLLSIYSVFFFWYSTLMGFTEI